MNLLKKRGRPSNAEIAAREAQPSPGFVLGMTEQAAKSMTPSMVQKLTSAAAELRADVALASSAAERAQAYAMRVWAGQSDGLGRGERVARVRRAVEGQGLSMEGVRLPGSVDDDEWTEEDEQPVTWRRARA